MSVVSGHIRTLKNAVAGDAKATRAAEAIELAAQRGETLTRQLLTFARRQTVNPTVIQVSERVEAFRAVLASSCGRGNPTGGGAAAAWRSCFFAGGEPNDQPLNFHAGTLVGRVVTFHRKVGC